MALLGRAPADLLMEQAELKRRLDGEPISDDAALRLLRYISEEAPGLKDLVGVAVDAFLLDKRPAWVEVLVGPRV